MIRFFRCLYVSFFLPFCSVLISGITWDNPKCKTLIASSHFRRGHELFICAGDNINNCLHCMSERRKGQDTTWKHLLTRCFFFQILTPEIHAPWSRRNFSHPQMRQNQEILQRSSISCFCLTFSNQQKFAAISFAFCKKSSGMKSSCCGTGQLRILQEPIWPTIVRNSWLGYLVKSVILANIGLSMGWELTIVSEGYSRIKLVFFFTTEKYSCPLNPWNWNRKNTVRVIALCWRMSHFIVNSKASCCVRPKDPARTRRGQALATDQTVRSLILTGGNPVNPGSLTRDILHSACDHPYHTPFAPKGRVFNTREMLWVLRSFQRTHLIRLLASDTEDESRQCSL